MSEFKNGDVVVWDGQNKLNPDYWNKLPEETRIKYYGDLGYGRDKPKLFVYLAPIMTGIDPYDDQRYHSGHCVLVSLDDQKIETMRHDFEFRLATDEEF